MATPPTNLLLCVCHPFLSSPSSCHHKHANPGLVVPRHPPPRPLPLHQLPPPPPLSAPSAPVLNQTACHPHPLLLLLLPLPLLPKPSLPLQLVPQSGSVPLPPPLISLPLLLPPLLP